MHPAPSRGRGRSQGRVGSIPPLSALHIHALLLAAVQRGEGADGVRARLAGLPPGLEWPAGRLSHLLHAAVDRDDDPGILRALLAHLGGGGPAFVAASAAPAAAGGMGSAGLLALSQQLLTTAVQRGNVRMVGVVLCHCGGDADIVLPAFPR
jgi:hypothetical protein